MMKREKMDFGYDSSVNLYFFFLLDVSHLLAKLN